MQKDGICWVAHNYGQPKIVYINSGIIFMPIIMVFINSGPVVGKMEIISKKIVFDFLHWFKNYFNQTCQSW